MTPDLTHLVILLAAIPVAAAIALFFYWLGHHHGRRSVLHRAPDPQPEHPHSPATTPAPQAHAIPAYRINELVTLLELGILTPEEFEQEKGKLYANPSA